MVTMDRAKPFELCTDEWDAVKLADHERVGGAPLKKGIISDSFEEWKGPVLITLVATAMTFFVLGFAAAFLFL